MAARLTYSVLLVATLACGSSPEPVGARPEPIVDLVEDQVACAVETEHAEHLVVRFGDAQGLGFLYPPPRGPAIVFISPTELVPFSDLAELGPFLAEYRRLDPNATRIYIARKNDDRTGAVAAAEFAADAGFSQVQRCDPWSNEPPLLGLRGETLVGDGLAAQDPAEGAIVQTSVTASGPLSQTLIGHIVRRHSSELRSCYEEELPALPELAGEVRVVVQISPAGAVTEASVGTTTLGNERVEACFAVAARRWTFPESSGSVEAEITVNVSPEPSD